MLVSTHLADGERGRVAARRNKQTVQVVNVVKSLRNRFGGQVILAGDLNSTVNTKPYNTVQYALLKRGFYDSFASARIVNSRFGTTNNFAFPVRATPHRRDYIFTYGGTRGSCRYVNRAYTRPSQTASDHFMQVATVPVSG